MKVVKGQSLSWERTFTNEDVDAFSQLSGDSGRHHGRAAMGPRMVHGLLTASLPTKLGGDIDYIARDMHFQFLRPVLVGDAIRCELTIVEAVPEAGRTRVRMTGACTNQHGKQVLRFESSGIVVDEPEASP